MKINLGLINISLVDGCNLSCRWCDRPDNFSFIELEFLEEIVEKINQEVAYAPYLQLIGAGEAMLHKEFIAALEIIGKVNVPGMRKELWTNLTINRGNTYEQIIKSDVLDAVVVSFDGYGDKTSFEYMRKGAKFEQLVKNVDHLCRMRDLHHSRCEIGVTSIYPEPNSIPFEHVAPERGRLNYEALFPKVDNIMFRQLHRYNGTFEVDGMPIAATGLIGPCNKAESGQLVIDTKGIVHPCCQDINHAFNIGDLKLQSIQQIMFKGKHKAIIDGLRKGEEVPVCKDCDECKYRTHHEMIVKVCDNSNTANASLGLATADIYRKQNFIDNQQVTLYEQQKAVDALQKEIYEKQKFIDKQRAYIDNMIANVKT